jgi:DNA polymerase-4
MARSTSRSPNPAGPIYRWILHVDLDQFLAAVEILRRPELRGRPVVVGGSGDPTKRREVVATASYEARAFGVHSGLPLRAAQRKCPEATFLPSDSAAYEAASRRVMATLRTFPVAVEELGWDEAFLGADTNDPERLAADIQRAVLDETGLHCSVGIGDNKHRAKLATNFGKPAGRYRLTADNWRAVMFDRPTTALWGIGPKMAKNLADMGITTVAELAAADPAELVTRFGPTMGTYYGRLGVGDGDTEVVTEPRAPRSRGRQITFPHDLTERADVEHEVVQLAHEMAGEAAAVGRTVVKVAVTVRYASFFTQTRTRTLPVATDDTGDIERAALTVLDRFDVNRPVRLLGVRVEFAPESIEHTDRATRSPALPDDTAR